MAFGKDLAENITEGNCSNAPQLNNKGLYGQHLNDLRVEQVWLQGVTGCNVTVTVVDDGNS